MGGTECSPATPAAEGVPHGGMGGARTDGGYSVTGPILKNMDTAEKKMFTIAQNGLTHELQIIYGSLFIKNADQ
jgi:hypothetical protein